MALFCRNDNCFAFTTAEHAPCLLSFALSRRVCRCRARRDRSLRWYFARIEAARQQSRPLEDISIQIVFAQVFLLRFRPNAALSSRDDVVGVVASCVPFGKVPLLAAGNSSSGISRSTSTKPASCKMHEVFCVCLTLHLYNVYSGSLQ